VTRFPSSQFRHQSVTTADLREQLQSALGTAYTIARELESGGMSRVFMAGEHALRRLVVVKVLRPELVGSVSSNRFRREMQLLATLQHPHIIPVLAAGDVNGLPYFIMPYVDGESLGQRMSRGPVSVRDTLPILKDIARALSYAHECGIIHRDIKPDNVLLSSGSAVVIDFGIVKAISDARIIGNTALTASGMAVGTPRYMAPEQASSELVDARTDLYAFGVTAYEMLAGTMPFRGGTPMQWIMAHTTAVPTPLPSRAPAVPGALSDLIAQCMSKDRLDRPASANEVLDRLEEIPPPLITGSMRIIE
jgi:eukaryotic-like serine/threonine-protein kinase